MRVSPGARLVWQMAGHESKLARVEQIEPEQVFCALLKFAEIDDEILEAAVAGDAAGAAGLTSERAQVKDIFDGLALPTTPTRRKLRRLCLGSHERKGEVVHRSPETRALFQQAAGMSDQGNLEARYLLRVCLEAPTAKIRRVLDDVGGQLAAPAPEPESVPKPRAEDSMLGRYGRELAPLVEAGHLKVPAVNTPQVLVLAEALQPAEPEPVLLVCEPDVPVVAIAAGAAKHLEDEVQVRELKLAELVREAPDADVRGDMLRGLLAEAVGEKGQAFFLDGTGLGDASLGPVLDILCSRASAGSVRLALAVGVEAYRVLVRPDPDQDSLWRVIWLHDLDSSDVPEAL